MQMSTAEKITELRRFMKKNSIDWLFVPDADPHQSEYVSEHFHFRQYISGFTGSNGVLLFSQDTAILWTDGRYFVQAKLELEGSGIELYKMGVPGVPTVEEFLMKNLSKGETLGFDGRLLSGRDGHRFRMVTKKTGAELNTEIDAAKALWPDRPALPQNPVFLLPESITGKSAKEKLSHLEETIKEKGGSAYLTAKLDSIMWLLNIRGGDVECNPVALSYFFMTDKGRYLFIQEEELSPEIRSELEKIPVTIRPYDDIYGFLKTVTITGKVLTDLRCINYSLLQLLEERGNLFSMDDPINNEKCVKNEVELKKIREYYLLDSVAVFRFMYWVKHHPQGLTELSAAAKMDGLRAGIPGFMGLSFPTISAYGENAAIVHYEATPDSYAVCKDESVLLVDSGGQYMGATTDVTRTYVLGPVSDAFKKHYTLVLAGCLRLGNLKFLKGATGVNLDIIARAPLWAEGIDFKHGTGHGIGAMLNVHEGPASIRPKAAAEGKDAVLQAGMILSDEPGVYLEGEYGIRLENICEILADEKTEHEEFLRMRFLTWVPFDPEAIDPAWLTAEDKKLLNSYHKEVCEKLSPHLNEEERAWLSQITVEKEY